ncbi:hypothetical protein QBC37DRAFT_281327 [Rhypophila decipiens]|uniref:Uncharacterized protein n=1 Tax=Rhypophila decipiens TaxID=261697 RepID=A0AAN6YAP5_9PEZI|nr:hypothetical protein QBC37DRAFT_281327 [Rhypophila decipiens]
MGALVSARTKFRRVLFTRQSIIAVILVYLVVAFIFLNPSAISWKLNLYETPPAIGPRRMTNNPPFPALSRRIPCIGPRGKLLSQSPDDDLEEVTLDIPHPTPWTGSYEAVGIPKTWTTIEGRYGPYGYGEQEQSYNRSKVDWNSTDWQMLQKQCFTRNARRFPQGETIDDSMMKHSRLRYRDLSKPPRAPQWYEFRASRRTAIVVRTWRGYEYKNEDLHYLRSLVVETALKTGGEYQVVLLVDMKDYEIDIFASEPNYLQALQDSGVPPEFESMAVLWDDRLLDTWYPLVAERRTMWQVFQPMQLFALHYPEFDHFWQLELDMRFTGDAGTFFDKMGEFARNEPRKQALERSMFQHMQKRIGDYQNFSSAVNTANNGSANLWGPLRIPDIDPIGPEPPVPHAANDTFRWGVGEDADVIVTAWCGDVRKTNDWVFRHWIGGFAAERDTPRYWCPPAIMRSSRALLLVAHEAQLLHGMYLPSEATLPSFALWHGLKLSFPQHPVFHEREDEDDFREEWFRGGPEASIDGFGPSEMTMPNGMGMSFWWQSRWPRAIMDALEGRQLKDDVKYPYLLAKKDGKVYVPNMVLHPVKHNS